MEMTSELTGIGAFKVSLAFPLLLHQFERVGPQKILKTRGGDLQIWGAFFQPALFLEVPDFVVPSTKDAGPSIVVVSSSFVVVSSFIFIGLC
jgi:hypothetical protein